MYDKSFFINQEHWNNAFSFHERKNPQLFVPSLKYISNFSEIELGKEVVFEDYDFDDSLHACKWLKNLYEFEYEWKKTVLFDNHNHAYFFWHKWKEYKTSYTLIHIDQHADMRVPKVFLEKTELWDMNKIFEYTNFELNVWDYIVPAQKDWLIYRSIQLRDTQDFELYLQSKVEDERIICNIDLDIFAPELDYIDEKLKLESIKKAIDSADFITVATSPFFINQELALVYFHKIFNTWH